MNNKYLLGLCLIFILMLSCGCASAMQQHNFGNDFSMNVPDGTNFEKIESELYDDLPFEETDYMDEGSETIIGYVNDAMISEENVDCNYDVLFRMFNPDLNECLEYHQDNLKVLEPESKDGFAVVGLHQDNKTVILIGHDVNQLIEMMGSVEFN